MWLLMGGLLGGAIAGTTGDYIVFVVPGILAFTVLSGIETTITAVTGDAAKTVTDRFRTLPISRGSVLLGRVFADMLTAAVELAVVTAAGLLLGWRPEGGVADVVLAYVLLLWLRFGLLWAGVWIGLKAGTPEAATTAQLAIWPVAFLSTHQRRPRPPSLRSGRWRSSRLCSSIRARCRPGSESSPNGTPCRRPHPRRVNCSRAPTSPGLPSSPTTPCSSPSAGRSR